MDGGASQVQYSPWGRKESDTTEQLHFHFFTDYYLVITRNKLLILPASMNLHGIIS